MANIDPMHEQILLLADMTKKTGMLHDGQITQLKYWTLILTNAVKFGLDFRFEDRTLIFNLLEFKGKAYKDQNKRFAYLSKWSKELLGDNGYTIIIQDNGKDIYNDAPIIASKHRAKRNRKSRS
jgi:hypothetical protein